VTGQLRLDPAHPIYHVRCSVHTIGMEPTPHPLSLSVTAGSVKTGDDAHRDAPTNYFQFQRQSEVNRPSEGSKCVLQGKCRLHILGANQRVTDVEQP
jgi:hypothetical protein